MEIATKEHAFLAEDAGAAVGFALMRRRSESDVEITDLYVQPSARSGGVATALVREALATLDSEVRFVKLKANADNGVARSVYQHWGFREEVITLLAPVEGLRDRLTPGQHAVSFASIHVQTDDIVAVERAVAAFAPRVGSKGSKVEGPRNGWSAIYDEVADRDPTALVRFAREVSSRMGAVVIALSLEVDQVVRLVALDRGGIVDEYLSVPEFYGSLPPGDVIGLAANPTVLQRLTGASPRCGAGSGTYRSHHRRASSAARASRGDRLGARSRRRRPRVSRDMITLYDAPRCPYCARVRLVLAEKRVAFDLVTVDLDNRPDWIRELNPPSGRVPVLDEDGLVLPESVVICEFLEERYPEPALLPADPGARAAARLLIERFDDLGDAYYAARRREDGARECLHEQLASLDVVLARFPWLTGQEFGLADIAVRPVGRSGHATSSASSSTRFRTSSTG